MNHPMNVSDKAKAQRESKDLPAAADGWIFTVYTDPLCCWTWAMQPVWKELITRYGSNALQFKMAGLIPSWKHFADQTNAISKPIQMGPEWMHARTVTGSEIDDRIWISDPPVSSYPACIAVKAAGLQGHEAAQDYFFLAQKAVMTERRNIGKIDGLTAISRELARSRSDFDAKRFTKDLTGQEAREAFKLDVRNWKYLQINRLPAMIVKNASHKVIALSGYQHIETVRAVLSRNPE